MRKEAVAEEAEEEEVRCLFFICKLIEFKVTLTTFFAGGFGRGAPGGRGGPRGGGFGRGGK